MFHNYLKNYINSTIKSSDPKFIIYSTSKHNLFSRYCPYVGGFADRIKGIITAYLIAIRLNRVFIIDWTDPWSLDPVITPNDYSWIISSWDKFLSSRKTIYHIDLIDDVSLQTNAHLSKIEQAVFLEIDVVILNSNTFSWDLSERLFPGESATSLFYQAFKSLFSFNVPAEMAAFVRDIEHKKMIRGGIIGVHLRTGDGNGWNDPRMSEWTEYENIILSAISKAKDLGIDDPAVYFASDNRKAKEEALTKFANRGLIVSNFEIGHVDRSKMANRVPFDHAITEFNILSKCDMLFGRAGEFYLTAALAGDKRVLKI